jgi:uncharacterized protein YbjQ (UPF0145 family)
VLFRSAFAVAVAVLVFAAGCESHRTYNVVKPTLDSASVTAVDPAGVEILQTTILDRDYQELGKLIITVSKTTLFDPDPTRAQVDEQLRLEAAKLGADAVIGVTYDGPKLGFASWAVMDGTGTAVKFSE